ncbi:MAG: hypothetical protein M9916_07180 [Crocinitomicaceae bacterium]|nr:hypothetical protein [Crocinitomicaceae bacterium]
MDSNKTSSLEELLLMNNFQILGTPFRFAEIIWKREGIKWNEAQRKASELTKANAALAYLEEVRKSMGIYTQDVNVPLQVEQPALITESVQPAVIIPTEEKRKRDSGIFEENYSLLTEFAPELEEELQTLNENGILSGKSAINIYGSASIKSVEKDKYGYYLLLDINEASKPNQSILLYVNTTAKEVQVLSFESNGSKFEVYNDTHTREMMNPQQLELQNRHLNKQLKRLIDFKLSIPTIGVVAQEKPIPQQQSEQQKETSDQLFRRSFLSGSLRKSNEAFESNFYYKLSQDMEELSDENETLQAENEELQQKNEELKQENEFLKNSVYRTLYVHNFKLLRLLVTGLTDEFELASFKVQLQSEHQLYPVFKLMFEKVNSEICCTAYQIDPEKGTEEMLCWFNIMDNKEVVFVANHKEFFGLKEEVFIRDHDKVSEDSVQANSALYNFFLTMLVNKYHSTITDRVYLPEVVESTTPETEAQQTEMVGESGGDGTGIAIVSVLMAVGLGIFGIRALNK